jgi:mycothiol synthase
VDPGTDELPARLEVVHRLDSDEVAAVAVLVESATETDGARPLNEHVMLHLRYGGEERVRNVLLYVGPRLAGYGHLDLLDEVAGARAEVVVHPEHRRRGLGRLLVQALLAETTDGRLRLWAHGDHPAAGALARSMGFRQSRALWQMRRSLYAALPGAQLPAGVSVRTFRPGRDDEEWVELNAKAFADHPEQGTWTVDDLRRREQEPWFDPQGFFLAERDGRMVGFHWTKVHGGAIRNGHDHPPIGEVYIVGVDPSEQGRGLGPALTLLGLHHLQQQGLDSVLLYVDESNSPAIRVYERLGFTRWATDVCWSRGPR